MSSWYENWVYDQIDKNRDKLTRQDFKTLVGQLRAGDPDGAIRGLRTILGRGGFR